MKVLSLPCVRQTKLIIHKTIGDQDRRCKTAAQSQIWKHYTRLREEKDVAHLDVIDLEGPKR
jgi:hypothetical protein